MKFSFMSMQCEAILVGDVVAWDIPLQRWIRKALQSRIPLNTGTWAPGIWRHHSVCRQRAYKQGNQETKHHQFLRKQPRTKQRSPIQITFMMRQWNLDMIFMETSKASEKSYPIQGSKKHENGHTRRQSESSPWTLGDFCVTSPHCYPICRVTILTIVDDRPNSNHWCGTGSFFSQLTAISPRWWCTIYMAAAT